MKKRKTYMADAYAKVYMIDKPTEGLTVKIKEGWARLYDGKNYVWRCNPVFFENHFIEEK